MMLLNRDENWIHIETLTGERVISLPLDTERDEIQRFLACADSAYNHGRQRLKQTEPPRTLMGIYNASS